MYGPAHVRTAAGNHHDFICGETLALELEIGDSQVTIAGYAAVQSVKIDDMDVVIALDRSVEGDLSERRPSTGAHD